jgi:hypothetical protein
VPASADATLDLQDVWAPFVGRGRKHRRSDAVSNLTQVQAVLYGNKRRRRAGHAGVVTPIAKGAETEGIELTPRDLSPLCVALLSSDSANVALS